MVWPTEAPYTGHVKLQGLRALIAIAEGGSFSEAALELGTSQSAVSNAIAELEEELGVRLFDRGRFGAVPTSVGNRVLAHARKVDGILDAIHQAAALAQGFLGGTVHVSAFRSAATLVLPQVIARLGERHPGLQVVVEELPTSCTDVTAALNDGKADLALTMSFLAEDAIFWELFSDPFVAVVRNEFRHTGPLIGLEALLAHPVILSNGPCSWPMRQELLSLDGAFEPAFAMSKDSTILGMVAQGLGVALMPELTAETLPPGVRRLDLAERVERRVGVALLPVALKVPAVRALLGVLRQMFPQGEVPHLSEQIAVV